VTTSEGVFPWGPALAVGADPQITAATPPTGGFAEFTTLTGSGFVDGFTTVFIKRVDTGVNYELGNFTVDNLTTITAQMPTWTVPGAFEITIDVGGVVSPSAVTWTQTNSFDEAATEDNSFWNTGGQADISVPADILGSLIGEPDDGLFGKMADWLFFAISGGTRTLAYENIPLGTEDMEYAVIDGGFNFFWCTDDHTGPGSPDGGECVIPGEGEELDPGVPSTGTWWLIPQEWGNVDTTYRLQIWIAE